MAHVGVRRMRGDLRRDAPGAVAERTARRLAGEQAVRDREARFPVLTPENAAQAIAWQENRQRELEARQ